MNRYYKIVADSEIGRQLADFHQRAVDADAAAEAYAVEMGATAYIQPSQYFAGGVEFLEFDKPVSDDLWRVRELGGSVLYEPNCQTVLGMMILEKDQPIPENTSNIIYETTRMRWRDIYTAKPIVFWALLLGYRLTGDNLADWRYIERMLSDKCLVHTLEYIGTPQAVEAERKRVLLPVVETADYYKVFGVWLPDIIRVSHTPVFFMLEGMYYLSLPVDCSPMASLIPVSKEEFSEAMDTVADVM